MKFVAKFRQKKISVCTRMLVKCFIHRKYVFIVFHTFMYLRTCFHHWKQVFFSGNKTLNKRSGANSKTHFLLKFATNFLFSFFFQLFCTKNAEKAYVDQCLEWAAPKCWLKYSTKVSSYQVTPTLQTFTQQKSKQFSWEVVSRS